MTTESKIYNISTDILRNREIVRKMSDMSRQHIT